MYNKNQQMSLVFIAYYYYYLFISLFGEWKKSKRVNFFDLFKILINSLFAEKTYILH
jgi:hypothetical protein